MGFWKMVKEILEGTGADLNADLFHKRQMIDLQAVEKELRQERRNQLTHGHDWDVADVMAVLRAHKPPRL